MSTMSLASANPPDGTGSTAMEVEGYSRHSNNQYAAHTACIDMLEASLQRIVQARKKEQGSTPPFQMADLGAADGSNSIATLRLIFDGILPTLDRKAHDMSTHIVFEEHPDSDEAALRRTLESHGGWFQRHGINHTILMKSYYEPHLFPDSSMDLLLSYICLHWLDTSNVELAKWKKARVETSNGDDERLCDFVFMNEPTAPSDWQGFWKENLAHRHLANFLSLRGSELRAGVGEMLLVMVGQPNDWVQPKSPPSRGKDSTKVDETTGNYPSVLTQAIQQCVREGTVRPQVLQRTFIPYFLRRSDDVRAAMQLIKRTNSDLELVEARDFEIEIGDRSSPSFLQDTFGLYWAIHSGAIRVSSGAIPEEMDKIRIAARDIYARTYDKDRGIRVNFVASVIRRLKQGESNYTPR